MERQLEFYCISWHAYSMEMNQLIASSIMYSILLLKQTHLAVLFVSGSYTMLKTRSKIYLPKYLYCYYSILMYVNQHLVLRVFSFLSVYNSRHILSFLFVDAQNIMLHSHDNNILITFYRNFRKPTTSSRKLSVCHWFTRTSPRSLIKCF